MTDEQWHPARLIPTAGIRGQEEQEKRATSSLLAVMGAVPEFGRALLEASERHGGGSRRMRRCSSDADGKLSIPDGVIVVERGQARWRALVEVKTGSAALKRSRSTATWTWPDSTALTPS